MSNSSSGNRSGVPARSVGARDGISGLAGAGRALRAREVSRPSPEQLAQARDRARALRDQASGRR